MSTGIFENIHKLYTKIF